MVAIPDRRRHLPRRKAGIEGASVSQRGSGKATVAARAKATATAAFLNFIIMASHILS